MTAPLTLHLAPAARTLLLAEAGRRGVRPGVLLDEEVQRHFAAEFATEVRQAAADSRPVEEVVSRFICIAAARIVGRLDAQLMVREALLVDEPPPGSALN